MMTGLKQLARKSPAMYHLLQRPYYGLRRLVETHFLGTRLQEWIWSEKRFQSEEEMIREFRLESCHSHRKLLINSFEQMSPFGSALEVGCNAGANLSLLGRAYPLAVLYGVDINPTAVMEGRQLMKSEDVKNVSLHVVRADAIDGFGDKSIDVVFTDATLIYVGPDKIRKVLGECLRISRKGLILNEWYFDSAGQKGKSVYHYGHWVHDYVALLSEWVSRERVVCRRVPPGVWHDHDWDTYGAIIEVK